MPHSFKMCAFCQEHGGLRKEAGGLKTQSIVGQKKLQEWQPNIVSYQITPCLISNIFFITEQMFMQKFYDVVNSEIFQFSLSICVYMYK